MMAMSCLRLHFLFVLCCVFASSILMINALVVGRPACRPDQIRALVQFKNEFESRGCNNSDYFHGVMCDNTTGAVTKLKLPSGCLTGILKPNSSLFELHHLRRLDLSGNNFTSSSLPSGFSNLSRLEVLSLYSNGFIGQVPSSFSNLSQFSYLDLSNNELMGSFDFVRNLSKLSFLDLSHNHFFGPLDPGSSLFEFHNLIYLNLADNLVSSSIPSEFSNLNRLEFWYLSNNGLHGQLPSSFGNLSRLKFLNLQHSELTGTLEPISKLINLQQVDLSFLNISFPIDLNLFSSLSSLLLLVLSGNSITQTSQIPSFSNLSQLSSLYLQDNEFTGIEEPISKLINLRELDLSFQNISYPIDLNLFSSLKYLMTLILSGNSISPASLSSDSGISLDLIILGLSGCDIRQFPNFFKNLDGLQQVDISNNKIKGKIPEWFWNLPNLDIVNLANNSFTGFEGSAEVLVNSTVTLLDLDLNNFEGPLPNPPHSLSHFSAWNNAFTGSIPLAICNRSFLTILDLSYNNFTGSIPRCLLNFQSSLTVLNLRKNSLEGSLPDMCNNGALLQTIDVGYNQLTGKLPKSLLSCSSLRFLNVENNKIKDAFPFWLKALPNLQILILSSNKFDGPISPPPGQGSFAFRGLHVLEISYNNFTGSLPSNYFDNWQTSSFKKDQDGRIYMGDYNHTSYHYGYNLDLRYKGLHMEQESVLTFYATIDFSGNKLEGQIPESIGLLKALIALNLSNNAFTGHIPLSLANVTELESLDLSNNQLSGTIPKGLERLSFLAYISVAHNQLKGEIPQGTQITGQPKSSFEGNEGLCGLPLEQSCFGSNAPPMQQPEEEKEEDEEEVLNWKAVAIGYGTGLLLGLSIAQVIASYKPEWLTKIMCQRNRRTR
uniref:Leucine-rich repeat-containing N-terminal plant-type domain-containing protein n=1 Tax=Brassica oleracea TaxID=3712 RepID=A0A3P6C0I0_BRAOL|nr:unnamed protein product [Brassica oleracea]